MDRRNENPRSVHSGRGSCERKKRMTNDDQGKDNTGADGVKLEWLVRGLDWKPQGKTFFADHSAGHYIVCHDYDGWRWILVNGRDMAGVAEKPFDTLEAAKAAAQADYTARILAALNADAIAGLVGASDALGSWMSAALDDPNVCEAMKIDINNWFAALARLGGGE